MVGGFDRPFATGVDYVAGAMMAQAAGVDARLWGEFWPDVEAALVGAVNAPDDAILDGLEADDGSG